MSFELIVDPLAAADLFEAYFWYEEQQPGLGEQFKQCADDCMTLVKANPYARARIYRQARSSRIRRFPYRVIYLVEGGVIKVLAAVHDSRHPRLWKERIRKQT